MKIGFISYSFTAACRAGELDIFKMIDWIVEKGGEHLEISPSPVTVMLNGDPAMTDKVRDYAAKRNLPLSSYTVGANFLTVTDENGVPRNKTAEERRAEIERVKTEVDVAARLGVQIDDDALIRRIRFPLHDHCKKKLGWSNAQVLMRFTLMQLVVMPFLLLLIVKVR